VRRPTFIATLLFTVLAAAPAHAQSLPPRLDFFFGEKTASAKRIVSYGRPATASGRLTGNTGAPIPGATLRVTVLEARDGATEVPSGTVTTKADGTFKVVVAPGPSRHVTVTYDAPAPDAPVSAAVDLAVRAGVLLHARPRELHTGQQLRLSGTLRGAGQPAAGKVIELQVRRAGEWRTFADVRSKHGTFSYRYRFSKVKTMRKLRFRALVPVFGAFPYAQGWSRSVGVTIRGRRSS
jgi:hypothetical protein